MKFLLFRKGSANRPGGACARKASGFHGILVPVAALFILGALNAFAVDAFVLALDINLPFSTSGDETWFYETTETNDGEDAVQSGPIGPNQSSVLQAQVTGPVYLDFYCKTSCEGYGTDYLSFGVDGDLSHMVAGEFPWMPLTGLVVPAGTHTVTWKYQKNGSVDSGSDCVFIDQITTTPGTPPANDNFADRIDLGSANPATASGNNTFATLESGESAFPYSGGYSGASVWWKWTAPSTGYAKFELLTADSSFRGAVAAFTGTAMGSLTRLAWANAMGYSYPQPPANITFPVTAGQTYQLAVHGAVWSATSLPAMGSFDLKVGMASAPTYRLTGLAIAPPSIDVTGADAGVAIDVTVNSDTAFTSGSLQLIRSNGSSAGFFSFDSSVRQPGGTDTNGTYRISTTIPRYSPPGNYSVESIALGPCTYGANVASSVSHASSLSASSFLLGVTDTDPDTTPPQLNSLTITPDPVDIRGGAQTITVDAAISDAQTGLRRWTLYLYKPDGTQATMLSFYHATPISGSSFNGVWRATYEVPAGSPGGSWSAMVVLLDELHNTATYGGSTGLSFPNGPAEGVFDVIAASLSNDMFADRFDLGSGLTASATGSNVGATMEAGENYTDLWGGSSIWWKWTAPASGWACVDTSGSAINTVLGVFTGSSVGSLTTVGWNVYAAWPETGSKLVFPAVEGTTYQIAVMGMSAGSGYEEGAVSLHVAAPVVPDIEMTSMAPDPATVDVTTASTVVNLVFTINTPAGFGDGSGVCWIYTPTGSILPAVSFDAGDRISGNDFAGTYSVPVTIGSHAPPGPFKAEVDLTDDAGTSAYYSNGTVPWADHVLPPPAGIFTFTVRNTGAVDTAPPILTSISIDPDPLNIGSGSGTTYVDLHVTDALSGVGKSSLWIFDPSGVFFGVIHFQDAQRISGDNHDGIYRVAVPLAGALPTGTWYVEVGLNDLLGNFRRYDSVNMPGGAATAEFEVISSSGGGSYDDWALTYFTPEELPTIGAFDADADGDGVPNGLEAVMGGHPRDAGNAPRTEGEMSATGGPHLVLHFNRAEDLPNDVNIIVQVGTGLAPEDWSPLAVKSGTDPWTGSGTVEEGTPASGLVPVSVHAPPASGPHLFMRVLVERISIM